MKRETFTPVTNQGRSWMSRFKTRDIWRAMGLAPFIGRQEERKIEAEVKRRADNETE
jgi:hypothetical protein